MQIQINTDHNIEGREALATQVSGAVESALSRVSDHITRVEVHLSDENSSKSGQNDKRCMMEARLEGRQPIAVTHQAATLDEAVDGAADKLARLIESTLGRLHDQRSHRTDPPPPGPNPQSSHERHHGEPAPEDRQRRRSPIRRPHDEGRGRLEHRAIREIGARVGRLLSHRGTGVGRLLPGKRLGAVDCRTERKTVAGAIGAVVFGSDQGLVGQFNDVVADYAVKTLAALPAKPQVWAVGERVHARLADAGLPLMGLFAVPNSVKAITPLVGQILVESEARHGQGEVTELHLFYNRPTSGAVYAPVSQRLLPLDENWRRKLAELPWPTGNLPEVMGGGIATLRALIREYLFVSLFRACAESLASENASRLAAMQRADKNIDELLEDLNRTFHRLRQSGIDEELFDVISGFEALSVKEK